MKKTFKYDVYRKALTLEHIGDGFYVGRPNASYPNAKHFYERSGMYYMVDSTNPDDIKTVEYFTRNEFLDALYDELTSYLKDKDMPCERLYLFKNGWNPSLSFFSRTKDINFQDYGIYIGSQSYKPGTCSVWRDNGVWQIKEIDESGHLVEQKKMNEVEIFNHLYDLLGLPIRPEKKKKEREKKND